MKALVVSGIWPPDPGGPASHAPALADFLRARGHDVEVVTTADEAPEQRDYPVHWVSRGLPTEMRYARCVRLVRQGARRSDVVYATSMVRRAAAGAALARRPLVVKLVSDEVFERAQREGRFSGTLDEFQRERGGRVRVLRSTRDRALRRAEHILSPSEYLRGLALGWGIDPERISVLPNPAPGVPELPAREVLREELELTGPTLAFAGRLGPQKAFGVALEAVAEVPEATLVVAGDGPERERLEQQATRARHRRPRAIRGQPVAGQRAPPLPRVRCRGAQLVVGEPAAHRPRGARRRDSGDRDRRGRRPGGGVRRRERAARTAR